MSQFRIGERWVGDNYPTYVIAEIGNNHNGDANIAKKLIEMAHECKADAVKFQVKDIERAFSKELLDMPYEKYNSFGKTYREHKQYLEFSHETYKELQEYARRVGIQFLATPFEEYSLKFLDDLDVPAIKIASFHMSDDNLLLKAAALQRPLIVSTGMSTIEEVDHAVEVLKSVGATFALLQCTSCYPTQLEDIHLSVIAEFKRKYNCVVGYSGHENGVSIAACSFFFGARILEKHFTLDRTMKGPDHAASLEIKGMRMLVERLREQETAVGVPNKRVLECELENRNKFRKIDKVMT